MPFWVSRASSAGRVMDSASSKSPRSERERLPACIILFIVYTMQAINGREPFCKNCRLNKTSSLICSRVEPQRPYYGPAEQLGIRGPPAGRW